jgi:2',3'-cyclic-nucleotide 2'-phosphodiesterase (5'-nucleotidase family)
MKAFRLLMIVIFMAGLAIPGAALAQPPSAALNAPTAAISFSILHTNDVHGQLEASGSNPGLSSVAYTVNQQRTLLGANNVLLVDAGDEMQGSLLSNLNKGKPVIDVFNTMGYAAATFGNHEFDWGQSVLTDRTTQATYPFLSANIVQGTCDATNWTSPSFTKPYVVKTVHATTGDINVGFIGVTTTETPTITIASATAGLCFKDPATSIIHYYDELKAQSDVVIVLSHLGFNDGGYGYGLPVYGDKTLADKLHVAGKYVPLIIGGHSHTNLAVPGATVVDGVTTVVQAYYNGRQVGRADLVYDTAAKTAVVTWQTLAVPLPTNPTPPPPLIPTSAPAGATEDATVKAVIWGYASNADYQTMVNAPIGYSAVDLPRLNGTVDNMMGTFVDDAIYNYLNTDSDSSNDIDIFFNNAGGIRTDWCYVGAAWVNTGCVSGTHAPALLTYGDMFTILPFGNATVVGSMTGAQIIDVLNQAPLVSNGVIQPAGLKFNYYAYKDANPGPQPYAWGAFDYCVVNKTSKACEAIDPAKTYKVGTNEFLAPAGGDGYSAFKYMTNITYWGDMLNAVDAYVTAQYPTADKAYAGPKGDGTLDGRITRDGTDSPNSGTIIPITILHNNDSHGNLLYNSAKSYAGIDQLATLIAQERLHNPGRTLLFNLGDQIQGDAMSYYFKSAGTGKAADGTVLPPAQSIDPIIAVMNSLHYDGMVLGNHEFNFGSSVFGSIFHQAGFPLLGANMTDSGAYGVQKVGGLSAESVDTSKVQVHDSLSFTLLTGNASYPTPIHIGFLGLTNHRVPNYELPSNIPGLTFLNPIDTAASLVPELRANNDAVVALTHIGFTVNPKSVEVDANVDTNLAATVPGIDAIIGGHSHTDPSKQTDSSGAYKYLPALVAGPNGSVVLINQAYRYNYYLGEVILGMRLNASGGYDVVSKAGRDIAVATTSGSQTPEDAATKAIIDPYSTILAAYNDTVLGQTYTPITAVDAYTAETNGADLQADSAVYELNQHGIFPDIHISGAMSNTVIATGATISTPVTLKISDMFTAMPYENSLVVLSMNGPQLKTVLERGYRNYFYYKHVPGYGGYSYYTTCMLDTDKMGVITYNDTYPLYPNGNNVVSLSINNKKVNFTDAKTYYKVSTVNYLAAGSCNFNDNGVTLWPLNQIVNDTQYYVRDAVIDYIKAHTPIELLPQARLIINLLLNPIFLPVVAK